MLFVAQNELLARAKANGDASEGKYGGGAQSAAASDCLFVAQHAY